MQKTPLTSSIQPEKVREFIIQMFDPPLESDVPNVYQMLSFMEQNQYEEEAVDGMWFPVKFAAPLPAAAIEEAVTYLETYEPYVEPLAENEEELAFLEEEVSIHEMEALLGESKWMLTKAMIETEQIESYMTKHEEAQIEQVVIEATTDQWSDAVNALTAISALVGNKKMTIEKTEEIGLREYERKWEWMNHEDRANIIRKRSKS
jgi:hypothetical protein